MPNDDVDTDSFKGILRKPALHYSLFCAIHKTRDATRKSMNFYHLRNCSPHFLHISFLKDLP